MPKRLLAIFLPLCILSIGFSHAQQGLTLDNLTTMQQGGPSAINKILLSKGWIFKGHMDAINSGCDFTSVSWVYAPSESDMATAFLSLVKDKRCQYAPIYQTGRLDIYNTIMATITRYKMNQIQSDVETNEEGVSSIVEFYEGKNYIVRVTVASSRNEDDELVNAYSFIVYRKSE